MENLSPIENLIPQENLPTEPSPKKNLFQNNFVFFGGVVLGLFFYFLFFSAPIRFPQGIIIPIEQGSSLRSVSLELKNAHIIRSRIIFEAFVIAYSGERHVVSSDYLFEKSLPVFEVARRIANGESHLAAVKVTIPEGYTISDITDTVSSKLLNFDKNKFISGASGKEGYLFPDTYFFLTKTTPEEVLKYMTDNFEKKIKPLRPEMLALGKAEKDIIIMASIIEKEAKEDDREIISGILWKRLSLSRALEVDAAPETYQSRGLPKNPICNPGLEAIRAAMYPANSPYLYYLHDSEGGVHYAKTFEEHKQNKLKYLK